MIKKANTRNGKILILIGAIVSATTPLVKVLSFNALAAHCPFEYGQRQCGIGTGLTYGFSTLILAGVWLLIGLTILGIGVYQAYSRRKK